MYIDTHSHIFIEYYSDIKKFIEDARENNVLKMITCGCDINSNEEVLKLVNNYDEIYGSIGFHPEDVNNFKDSYYKFLENNINNNKIVAIGEIGLDYHYDDTNKDLQKEVFIKQLDMAVRYNKPVIIHSRDSIQDTLDIIKLYRGKLKGVVHCFSSSIEIAREITKLGLYIGVGGIVTFKNAKNIIEVINNIDLKYILLETDCPYLTPEPYRKYINESKYIPIISNKIADIKGIGEEVVRDITTSNAKMLFDI